MCIIFMKIKLILAINNIGVIGHDLKMLWKLSDDLKHFKKETINSPILMGSNTFKSLPGILPDREHIVISSNMESNKDVSVFTTIKLAMDYIQDNYNTVYVIGGAHLVKQILHLNLFDELIITHVDNNISGNVSIDTEILNLLDWTCYDTKEFLKSEKNEYDFKIKRYIKAHDRFY